MPNWVDNSVSVSGSEKDIEAFVAKATAVHPCVEADGGEVAMTTEPEFSFWNFVRPPQEAIDSGEYFGTHGYQDGKTVGHTPNNWYEWNNREWNTKWDACDVNLDVQDGGKSVWIGFQTAWSIPVPVFEAMVKQHPELEFEMRSQEEQGWGAEYTSSDGEEDGEERSLIETSSWDIPESHQDWVDLGDPEGCVCEWSDEDDWYDDCPRESKEREIVAHDANGSVTAEKLRSKFDSEFGGLVE